MAIAQVKAKQIQTDEIKSDSVGTIPIGNKFKYDSPIDFDDDQDIVNKGYVDRALEDIIPPSGTPVYQTYPTYADFPQPGIAVDPDTNQSIVYVDLSTDDPQAQYQWSNTSNSYYRVNGSTANTDTFIRGGEVI